MLVRTLACTLLLALAAPVPTRAAQQGQEPPPDEGAIENPNLPPPPEVEPGAPAPAIESEPEPEVTLPERVPAPRAQAPMLHGRLGLSLEDAIKMGLENNLDVQVERYSPLIAGKDEQIAWGAFDPTAFAEFGYLDSKTPSASTLSGTNQVIDRKTDGFGGLRGLLPLLGTHYEARFGSERETINVPFSSLSPEYNSNWTLAITQPVLRDLIWNQPWTQVKTTRLLFEGSQENFRTAVMDTVRAIEDAYWNLIAAREEERVAEKSLETAKALLDQTRTQFEVGVVSKVEVTEAEAGLSQREVTLIRARNQYRNQQDALIDLILGQGLRAASTLEIDPTDNPVEVITYEIELEAAVARAYENRPEVQVAQKEIQRQEVLLAFAKNQRLPALDGIFSAGQSGLSGNQNPDFVPFGGGAVPPGQGGYSHTFADYDGNPVYTARARFSIPIPNTSARKTVDRTEFELSRAETRLRRLEQNIILEVRTAARNLTASQEGINAAQDARRAADEQLRAERIRLEYGESTPFDVLQREEQLVDRETELINAYRAYRLSVTGLDRAQGTILRNRNIAIADVAPLR